MLGLHAADQALDVRLSGDVAADRHTIDLARDRVCTVPIDVGYHDNLRSLCGESSCECAPNASRTAGDHNDSLSYIHGE
jgi:hypothetical protein